MFSILTEQQYFDIEKRLAESQEQFLSSTKDLQTFKEENKKISEFLHTSNILGIEKSVFQDSYYLTADIFYLLN